MKRAHAEPAATLSRPERIEDYALIGDCHSAALVRNTGSIDWLCLPRFDSDACLAALVGQPENGTWTMASDGDDWSVTRQYRDDTLVLETRFSKPGSAFTIIDYMPPRAASPHLVRLVRSETGRVPIVSALRLRFGYGAAAPWTTPFGGDGIKLVAGPDMVVLRATAPLVIAEGEVTARFTLEPGETVAFVLSYGASYSPPSEPIDPHAALAETERFWRDWSQASVAPQPYAQVVRRSLITLKALTYQPTGGIVAAPTTSLPEKVGGDRNWDYRYCWLRDATLTLLALLNAGHEEEAAAWRDWLLRAVAGEPDDMQIMYGIGGERRLTEWHADWLRGFLDSQPVRIGNAAHQQVQLDVFGELIDALHQARNAQLDVEEAGWSLQCALLDHLAGIWQQADAGIWEMRGPPRHFTYSKALAWVAFDRSIKDARRFGLAGPVEDWTRIRDDIHADICARGYDEQRGSFVQSYGSTRLDASLLLLVSIGFLPPTDPRIVGTIQAIETELLKDGMVLRYDTQGSEDGLTGDEGAFVACSFWLVDAYVALGRNKEAQTLFERLIGLCNDVGLLAEEYDAGAQRQTGNFPQAFSHVALINAALNLTRQAKIVDQRTDGGATGPSQ